LEMGIAIQSHSSYVEVPYTSFFPLGLASPPPSTTSGSHDRESSLEATPLTIPNLGIEPQVEIASEFPMSYHTAQGSYAFRNEPFPDATKILELNQTVPDKIRSPLMDQHPKQSCATGRAALNQSPSWTLDVDRFIHRLVSKGVCLGRAPGFRKQDVDATLAFSRCEL